MKIIVNNIKIPFDCDDPRDQIESYLKKRRLGRDFTVYKESLDARRAPDISFVYSVVTECDGELPPDCRAFPEKEDYIASLPVSDGTGSRPVVVGFGPGGMFCALLLAERGFRPIVLEQGDDIDTRARKVEEYFSGGSLDAYSNVQFGEGGAGSFSDGKLITRIKDSRCAFVLSELVRFGADREILTLARPHIGTDRLRGIVKGVRNRIIELGGEVRFNTRVTDILPSGNGAQVCCQGSASLCSDGVFLALGHSARKSFAMLRDRGFRLEAKDFSVGMRIEHLRRDVEQSLYGAALDSKYAYRLPSAEYNVSARWGNDGVYSFCMCPGGVVVPSADESDGFVTNGMSYYARDGVNSNSAIAFSVTKEVHGGDPFKGMEFQRSLEKKAFLLGGGKGKAPCQTLGDFADNVRNTAFSDIRPSVPVGCEYANLNELFDGRQRSLLMRGISHFAGVHSFFADKRAVLTAVESRTSSPVRITRGDTLEAVGFPGIYPVGEGAGYAGGITSAATDGLRAAESYILKTLGKNDI